MTAMAAGRNPSWSLLPYGDAGPVIDAVVIASQSRITLAPAIRRRTHWLKDASGAVSLLAHLDFVGHLMLRPAAEIEAAISTAARNLLDNSASSDRNSLAVAIQSRFGRLTVDPTGRIVFPELVLGHLQVSEGHPLFVVSDGTTIEVASPEFRLENWHALPDALLEKFDSGAKGKSS